MNWKDKSSQKISLAEGNKIISENAKSNTNILSKFSSAIKNLKNSNLKN